MKKFLTIFSLLACFNANALTGNEYIELALDQSSSKKLQAWYYLEGIIDQIRLQNEILTDHNIKTDKVCIPTGVLNKQIIDLINQSINNDPAHRHINASLLIYYTLLKQWPCK